MTTRMPSGAHSEKRGICFGRILRTFVALATAGMLIAGGAAAFDWSDEDCSHWDGTPKYAECVQAHARLAESDCGQWVTGEKEFVKCQHAHNIARLQKCAQGSRVGVDGHGNPIVTVAPCRLANEDTGVIEGQERPKDGEQPVASSDPEARARARSGSTR
jgi:hypothetical protein